MIPCRYSSSIRSYGVGCNITIKLLWLVSLMPAVQDTVAVEGVGVEASFPSKTSQAHYLIKVVRLRLART